MRKTTKIGIRPTEFGHTVQKQKNHLSVSQVWTLLPEVVLKVTLIRQIASGSGVATLFFFNCFRLGSGFKAVSITEKKINCQKKMLTYHLTTQG